MRGILEDVRRGGDAAVFAHTERLDGVRLTPETLRVSEGDCDAALAGLDPAVREGLALAAARIENFHRRQRRESWFMEEAGTGLLGQLVRPLDRVGLYVPGGSAAYPSSVLMNAIPATVAGVAEIAICTPVGKDGRVPPAVLAAAALAGVREIYRIGGAQAVGAMAYGTASIRPVDKIVGPGNVYVATAKRLVFGVVGIDMVAGPSEILVVADAAAPAEWVAADLLAQAEHDPLASAVCVTPSAALARAVLADVERQLALLPRGATAAQALARFGAVIVLDDLASAVALPVRSRRSIWSSTVADPWALVPRCGTPGRCSSDDTRRRWPGTTWPGRTTSCPPRGRRASGLPCPWTTSRPVSSLVSLTPEAIRRWRDPIVRLAELEGLDGHARSITIRTEGT